MIRQQFRNGVFTVVRSSRVTSGKNFGKTFYILRADDGSEWLAMGKTKTPTLTARKRGE